MKSTFDNECWWPAAATTMDRCYMTVGSGGNTIRLCLSVIQGWGEDTKEDLKLQQAFRYQVVDVIEELSTLLSGGSTHWM